MATERTLAGRTAVITGSGRGIGLAIAETLAAAGAHVAIQDIDAAVAEGEASRLRAAGSNVIAFDGDLTDLDAVTSFGLKVQKALGHVDILINNVGVQEAVPWLSAQPDAMLRQYRCNVVGPIMLAQMMVPGMIERRWGRIINIGSIQQLGGNPNMMAYGATKAALANVTVAWARDLAKHNILVNTIAPGWFETLRNHGQFGSEQRRDEVVRHAVPLARLGQPADCSGIALLLCTEASSYITGQTLHVDGGMSL